MDDLTHICLIPLIQAWVPLWTAQQHLQPKRFNVFSVLIQGFSRALYVMLVTSTFWLGNYSLKEQKLLLVPNSNCAEMLSSVLALGLVWVSISLFL